jgi:Ran GTPase-activating protein (RanGAP) involved in mRNA processing and transport
MGNMLCGSNDSASTYDGVPLLPKFLEFCEKVRNNDPSILPGLSVPFRIRDLSEKEHIELADALLENTNVTYLLLDTDYYTKNSAEAMAKYLRTSRRLQRVIWCEASNGDDRELRERDEIICCFLHAFQESTSLKILHINFLVTGGPSNLALESMLRHTQSLRSLGLRCPVGSPGNKIVAAAASGLKKNTTLRELTLIFPQDATTVSPLFTSLREHPHLRRLCLSGHTVNLTELETVLSSDTSQITELEIYRSYGSPAVMGLTPVLQAFGRSPTLTKLRLRDCPLDRDDASLLCMTLCNIPSLQTLDLARSYLGSSGLEELASALYHNTSIEVLDVSVNRLGGMESAEILRDILRSNKTITTLNLSGNEFGQTAGAVECITDGLGSNSTLLKIDLSYCALGDGGVSTLAQTLGSRNTTLQKLTIDSNSITSTGVGALLAAMEQSSHITDLEVGRDPFGNEGLGLLARSLGNNALPNLTRLSLSRCGIGDDGFIALLSALEQNTSLLHLDLRNNYDFSELAFLALAETLPQIKVLQEVHFYWCPGLVSAIPLLLEGLHNNTSLFRVCVNNCAPSSFPPTAAETSRCAGSWMQEMNRVGYRNRFLSMIRAPKERLSPRGVWPHALARVATIPAIIFEVLRSKPSLVPSKDADI